MLLLTWKKFRRLDARGCWLPVCDAGQKSCCGKLETPIALLDDYGQPGNYQLSARVSTENALVLTRVASSDWSVARNRPLMTVDLRGAAYAASRNSSTLKGTKQFGWLQVPATNPKDDGRVAPWPELRRCTTRCAPSGQHARLSGGKLHESSLM
jgi:hypothetical protein